MSVATRPQVHEPPSLEKDPQEYGRAKDGGDDADGQFRGSDDDPRDYVGKDQQDRAEQRRVQKQRAVIRSRRQA